MKILDGGMGQELLRLTAAEPTNLWATQVMMDRPDAVRSVHDSYFAAGADVATTNTYAIHHDRLVLAGVDDEFRALHEAACSMARDARAANGRGMVAGSLGPLGWSYRPDMTPPVAEAAEAYAEIIAIHKPLVDVHLFETISSIESAQGALAGARDTDLPVWLSVSVDDADGTKLRSGEPIADVLKLSGYAALLINCSRPEAVTQGLRALSGATVPLGAYANGFTMIADSYKTNTATVHELQARKDLDPDAYLAHAKEWAAIGADIIGGCCEVGPAHIARLSAYFADALV